MKVQKIDFLPRNIAAQNGRNENKPQNDAAQLKSFNPPAYKDFNVSFGERLFRTPANFFAQPFNKKGMPQTMKNYINADYEDRQNMPPAQMMKLVFDDINETKNLEQVKRIFPNEPLFENLRDVPNRKSRVGILAEIELMKEDNKPLFKNGNDNLGLYVLKKIYLEGKTLKEINKDFEKDLSDNYKGISAIDYATLNAYGIKFPNSAFWNSFIATREDFPYVYKPRKPINPKPATVKKEYTLSDIKRGEVEDKRPPRFKPDTRDLKVLTDAAVDKNPTAALSKLRRKGGKNAENATFIEKYFGQINSVALEKIHVSEEMREYFQNPENVPKNVKERMDKYWKTNSQARQLRSMAMSDTIKLFFEAYGPDGNNEVFQDLLKYADSIKPEREKRLAEHNRIQQELEDALAVYEEPKKEELLPANKENMSTEDILKEEAKKFNADLYKFETEKGPVIICSNLKEAYREQLENFTKVMPKSFAKSFINYMEKNPKITDEYILTAILNNSAIDLPKDERLMDLDEVEKLTIEAYNDYSDKNRKQANAAQQAIIDAFFNITKDDSISAKIFTLGVFEFPELLQGAKPELVDALLAKSDLINKNYAEYKRDLSLGEINKIVIVMNELMTKYSSKNTIIGKNSPFAGYSEIFDSLSENIRTSKKIKMNLKML